MSPPRRHLLAALGGLAAMPAGRLRAQGSTIRIGVMTGMSGPYRDPTGMGRLVCAQRPRNYYTTIATTAAEDAFRPMNEGGCPLVRG